MLFQFKKSNLQNCLVLLKNHRIIPFGLHAEVFGGNAVNISDYGWAKCQAHSGFLTKVRYFIYLNTNSVWNRVTLPSKYLILSLDTFHVNFYKNCPAAVHIATALLCNTYWLFPFFFFLFLSAKLFLLLKNAVKNTCSSLKFKDASLKHSDREVVTALTYVTILPKFENSWLTFFMINLQFDLVG